MVPENNTTEIPPELLARIEDAKKRGLWFYQTNADVCISPQEYQEEIIENGCVETPGYALAYPNWYRQRLAARAVAANSKLADFESRLRAQEAQR